MRSVHLLATDGSCRYMTEQTLGGAVLFQRTPVRYMASVACRLDYRLCGAGHEWYGLNLGLRLALHFGVSSLLVAMDDRVVVEQMRCEATLGQPVEHLWAEADELVSRFSRVEFRNVSRNSFAMRAAHVTAAGAVKSKEKQARIKDWIRAIVESGVRPLKSMSRKDFRRHIDLHDGGMSWVARHLR